MGINGPRQAVCMGMLVKAILESEEIFRHIYRQIVSAELTFPSVTTYTGSAVWNRLHSVLHWD